LTFSGESCGDQNDSQQAPEAEWLRLATPTPLATKRTGFSFKLIFELSSGRVLCHDRPQSHYFNYSSKSSGCYSLPGRKQSSRYSLEQSRRRQFLSGARGRYALFSDANFLSTG
jgi:hypothetical protein